MKKTKTKCYLYTRVSTSMQVDGYSLDAQRDKLRKYAEYEDMVVAGEYSDEGFSGKNIQGRHEFQRMLQDIQDCKDGVEYAVSYTHLDVYKRQILYLFRSIRVNRLNEKVTRCLCKVMTE